MSLAKLLEIAGNCKRVDPDGREYQSSSIEGASKGHWLVCYRYRESYGYSESSFWKRMTDQEMIRTNCFADEYEGVK